MRITRIITILLIGILLALVACSPAAPPTTPPNTTLPETETPISIPKPSPAKFTVSALSVVPGTCKTGESVTVSVTVTNSGGSKGMYNVVFKVNGTEEAKMGVTLDAGGSQKVSYTLKKDVAGTYSVDVNGLTSSFVVARTVTPTDIVHITRTGEKYHRAGCRYLSKSDIPIERAEAIRRGYTPCSVCRP